jgi:hypothetical protein
LVNRRGPIYCISQLSCGDLSKAWHSTSN